MREVSGLGMRLGEGVSGLGMRLGEGGQWSGNETR